MVMAAGAWGEGGGIMFAAPGLVLKSFQPKARSKAADLFKDPLLLL